ncbi:coenzyme F420-dependent oxidoreductase, NP1902A family [Halovivax ruber XH-70]|uniref:Coenzyme F420-dependent oxidoreductase, NP1902A family n=1 Tax=Halovivax ruber (strain DSM 18193 / JCM 13892 / XH-70) TaxID=797302 RepID=L0IDE4_HALRX|nr:TIGR04024 family LLM class F420-dependent oxidoreductase [Halovivax ruber]AGB15987.1 coenzyme F420-dependent oxidoreductase, NP1902A family [Halovivax ruber XH-70]
MTTRTLHLPVSAPDRVESFVEYATLGESVGYEHVWLPETWGRDAVSVLTRIATETSDIGFGPSVLNVYSRSPALVGQTAASLQELSDGRLRVAVGPSGQAVIEGWHGESFDRPLRRTREFMDVVRAVLSGEVVNYAGDIFSLGGFRLRCDPPEATVPIEAAGMGPKSVELAGRFADGWHATVFTPHGFRDRLEDLERGIDLGDRSRDDVTATLSLTAAVHDDGDLARQRCRNHLAFYVGAMGTYYRESLARQGYEDEAMEIAAAVANDEHERVHEIVDDEMLADLAIAGTPEEAHEQLATWEAIDGLDELAISFPRGATHEEVLTTIDALGPEA